MYRDIQNWDRWDHGNPWEENGQHHFNRSNLVADADGSGFYGVPRPMSAAEKAWRRLQENHGMENMEFITGVLTTFRIEREGAPGDNLSGITVEAGCKVTCHAEGRYFNKEVEMKHDIMGTKSVLVDTKRAVWTQFWDSRGAGTLGEPFKYTAGSGQVVRGWDAGCMGMKLGEVRELKVPPEEGYGKEGYARWKIPPRATLAYRIEVLGIEAPDGRSAFTSVEFAVGAKRRRVEGATGAAERAAARSLRSEAELLLAPLDDDAPAPAPAAGRGRGIPPPEGERAAAAAAAARRPVDIVAEASRWLGAADGDDGDECEC